MSVPSPEEREDAVTAVLRGLSVSAARANLARSLVIAEALDAAEGGRLNEQQRLAAAAAAHQVVGSAGTFGMPRASRTAARLEDFLVAVASPENGAAPAGLDQARLRLDELTELLAVKTSAQPEMRTGAQTDGE